jgi:hypothetical protein
MICPCGSDLVPDRCRDEKGEEVFACESCKPGVLHRIFDEKYLDIFQEWTDTILLDPPPIGYEWQWEDFLKERGCEQVVGLDEAIRRKGANHFLVDDPNGESFAHWGAPDRSVRILVPREYGERVLKEGRMN